MEGGGSRQTGRSGGRRSFQGELKVSLRVCRQSNWRSFGVLGGDPIPQIHLPGVPVQVQRFSGR
jgi:hypothetical protein